MNEPSNPGFSLPLSPDSLSSSQPVPLDEISTLELVSAFLQAKAIRATSTVAIYAWALNEFAEANSFLPLDPVVIETYLRAQGWLTPVSIMAAFISSVSEPESDEDVCGFSLFSLSS